MKVLWRFLLLGVSASIAAGQPPKARARTWLDEKFLKIHLEFNVPIQAHPVAERFDRRAFQNSIRASRVQVVTLMAKDAYGNSFFRTEHGYFDKGLNFDLIQRQIEALRELGIKVLAHYSVGDDAHIDLFHPDWLCQDLNGKPLRGGPVANRICLNSPYREKMLLPQLEELVRLGLDGLWLDIFRTPEGCFCPYCRRKFRDKYGAELASSDPRSSTFWWDSREEALEEINHRVRTIKPEIAITFNGAHMLSHARRGLVDFFTTESHVNPETGYEIHNIAARYLRALGVPFDVQNMTNLEAWDDSTLKSSVQLQLEFSQILANGGKIAAGTQLYPWGEYDPESARVLGQAFEFMEARLPFVSGARSVPYAAVLVDQVAPGRGSWSFGADPGLTGIVSALAQIHLQFDILEEVNAGLDLLSKYKLVVLPKPETAFRSPEGRAALARFLAGGGRMLLISSEQEPSQGLLAAMGPGLRSQRYRAVRGTLAAKPGLTGFPFQGDVLTLEGAHVTTVVGLQAGGRTLPAVSLLGERAAYIAWPLGRQFYQTGYPEWRSVLQEAISALQLDPPYEVQAPATLDTNMMERPGEFLLHLVHMAVQKGLPGLMPFAWNIPALSGIPVTVRCPRPRSVLLEPGDRALNFSYDGKAVHFTVPKVQIYEIARIRWQ